MRFPLASKGIIMLKMTTLAAAGLVLFLLSLSASAAQVHKIRVDGAINPVSARYIIRSVERAEKAHAEALIIELDTPGGLLEATRDIVQTFLASEVPVVVYVSPAGARAGSAGVFITLAAHIAVMAPGANIGAAHPVTIGGGGGMPGQPADTSGSGVMSQKMTNDAAAMIRAIAEERGRNIEWAEKAVRESASITAKDAVKLGVIDLIAADVDTLLRSIDGRIVKLKSGETTLSTQQALVQEYPMDWNERLLDQLADPNIAYILMMLGIYGLIFEITHPGAIFPGVVGGICLLLAFLAFQTLPVNTVGAVLVVFGIILLLLELKVPSYGMLTIGGATALALGSFMLIDTPVAALRISASVIITTVVLVTLFTIFAVFMGVRAHFRKATTGQEGLTGEIGEVIEDLTLEGMVFVRGEYWRARSSTNIKTGEKVRVLGMEEMMLRVERASGK